MATKKSDKADETETGTRNPNQGTDDAVDKTRYETVETNAGPDAVSGGVADQEE
jgi:hypothetical protein